jgi:hypothetical protein
VARAIGVTILVSSDSLAIPVVDRGLAVHLSGSSAENLIGVRVDADIRLGSIAYDQETEGGVAVIDNAVPSGIAGRKADIMPRSKGNGLFAPTQSGLSLEHPEVFFLQEVIVQGAGLLSRSDFFEVDPNLNCIGGRTQALATTAKTVAVGPGIPGDVIDVDQLAFRVGRGFGHGVDFRNQGMLANRGSSSPVAADE